MIIIDRLEGGFAVCEADGVMKDIPLCEVEPGAKEGDVIVLSGGVYLVDEAETEKRKKRAEALFGRFKSR